jgi:hypothetical protein
VTRPLPVGFGGPQSATNVLPGAPHSFPKNSDPGPLRATQTRSYLPPMFWRSCAPARRPAGFIEPCLPTVADAVPSGSQWVHEIKHDGYRFICRRDDERRMSVLEPQLVGDLIFGAAVGPGAWNATQRSKAMVLTGALRDRVAGAHSNGYAGETSVCADPAECRSVQ